MVYIHVFDSWFGIMCVNNVQKLYASLLSEDVEGRNMQTMAHTDPLDASSLQITIKIVSKREYIESLRIYMFSSSRNLFV